METIEIFLDGSIDVGEFKKSICFVSPAIVDFSIDKDILRVVISENDKVEDIRNKLKKMMKKYTSVSEGVDVYYTNGCKKKKFYSLDNNNQDIFFWGNGQVSFSSKGKFILDYFDNIFAEVAIDLGAVEKIYPTLLPVQEYFRTGYIKKTPQYSIFCNTIKDEIELIEKAEGYAKDSRINEIFKEPQYALSPSACFHTYIENKNKILEQDTIITFRQNVFRNEGRLNYNDIGRLCDYNVREIVMIGSDKYVEECRKKIMEKTSAIMKKYGLLGDIKIASDSFVIPRMQMYRKIQKIDKSKYEMHLKINAKEEMAVASFNLHGKAFSDPFNINVKGEDDTVTACVGYGLQRWVIAFLCQFGFDEKNWPNEIADEYRRKRELRNNKDE